MDQGDHGDHRAGCWTRSTVVPLLHIADVNPPIAGHCTTCLKVSASDLHLGQVGSLSWEDVTIGDSYWEYLQQVISSI